MRLLTLTLYGALALLLLWFSARNWVPVTVALWPPFELVIRLPVLILLSVLLGALPGLVLHRVTRWRLTRRLGRTEQELALLRMPAAETPAPPPAQMPPQAQPMIVPPAGA
jgi:lipopolysaccharide assembly protein A